MYKKVRIKSSGILGTVVDILKSNEKVIYTVESDTENTPDGYGGKWKLYECDENDIEFLTE